MSNQPSRLDTLRTLQVSNLDVAFATAFGTLVSGTFLIGFVQSLGGSDFWIQIVVALPSFMGLFQIPGAIWGRRYPFYKRFIQPAGWIWRLLYLPLIVLPFLPWPPEIKLIVLALCIGTATIANQMVGPIYNDWIAELVPAKSRGWFFSRRTAIATGVGMSVAFMGGILLDALQKQDKSQLGFSLLFAIGFVCAVISMMFFLQMGETKRENPIQVGIRDSLKLMVKPAQDRDFQKVLVFTIVFMISATIAGGLYVAFARESLKLSYTAIQSTQAAHAVGTVAFANMWGYLADKYGNKPLLAILMVGVMVTPVTWLLCIPGQPVYSIIVLIVGHLFNGLVWSGVAVCQMNLFIATSKLEDRANYLGMVFAVQAVVGGISPLVGAGMMHFFRESMSPEHAYKAIFVSVIIIRVVALITLLPVKEEGSSAISQTLGQLGRVNPRGIRALRRMARTADPAAKAKAIQDVGHAQMPLASGELLRALSDPSPAVRRQASRALGRLNDPDAALAVIEFVRTNRELVEEETLDALGDMGAKEAVSVVIPYLSDPRSPLRRQAARTLGYLGSHDALESLEAAARDPHDSELRRAAIQAIRILSSTSSVEVIAKALQDPTPSVRAAAAEAVAELNLTDLAEDVRNALAIYGDSYASELAYALGTVGEAKDVAQILAIADKCSSETTRRRCLLAVARLFQVENTLYKLFALQGLSRDQELILMLKPAYQKSKRLREAVQTYSLGLEEEALNCLVSTRVAKELSGLAGHKTPELFLVAALAYATHG